MFVYSQGKFRVVKEREDGSKYYMLNGDRQTVRKTQKLYAERRKETSCSLAKDDCQLAERCSWMKNRGCRVSSQAKYGYKPYFDDEAPSSSMSMQQPSASGNSLNFSARATSKALFSAFSSDAIQSFARQHAFVSGEFERRNGRIFGTLRGHSAKNGETVDFSTLKCSVKSNMGDIKLCEGDLYYSGSPDLGAYIRRVGLQSLENREQRDQNGAPRYHNDVWDVVLYLFNDEGAAFVTEDSNYLKIVPATI